MGLCGRRREAGSQSLSYPWDLSENQDEPVRGKRRISFVPEKGGCADMRARRDKS
jgi:hypothetical protein